MMTIKERFNARVARVREYKKNVSICRDMKNVFYEARKDITATVDPLNMVGTVACIKVCHTFFQPTPSSDVNDTAYFQERYCPCFNDEHCSMYGCSYHSRNAKYKEQKLLLQRAISEKRTSFRRIFERIK